LRVAFSIRGIEFWISDRHNPITDLSKLPYDDFLAQSLACGFWLPSADKIRPMGTTGLHYDTMQYDREYVTRQIGEIGGCLVHCLLLPPPVGYVRYPKCTTILHLVAVVNIDI
jgi:hypothetical protein